MLKLLILRAAPLLLRPAVVILEGLILKDLKLLTLVIPISMIALILSSIPVHLEYFRSNENTEKHQTLALHYISALTWITLTSTLILVTLLLISHTSKELTIIIGLSFIIEKLSDETSRSLEFNKKFTKWALVQSLRATWYMIPVLLYTLGADYINALLATSMIFAIVTLRIFTSTTSLKPNLKKIGIPLINNNIIFLIGSILPASYQQAPRLIIAKFFPEIAHIYLAASQVCQGVSLIFNVKYQIPYRKMIARHTVMFQHRLRPIMYKLLAPIALTSGAYLIFSPNLTQDKLTTFQISMLLAPAMIAESLAFAIIGAHLGYLSWIANKKSAAKTYITCILIALSIATMMLTFNPPSSILEIPATTTLIGLTWLAIITKKHFPLQN